MTTFEEIGMKFYLRNNALRKRLIPEVDTAQLHKIIAVTDSVTGCSSHEQVIEVRFLN